MKQFDWTTSVARKCGPKKLDQRGEMKNDNKMSFGLMKESTTFFMQTVLEKN